MTAFVLRLLAATSLVFFLMTGAFGTTERVLHSFTGNADGISPEGGLVADASGNLYGVTFYGGPHGGGTIFRLSSHGVLTNLYSFNASTEGTRPQGPLLLDAAGNLYGTMAFGGTYGDGTVFELVHGTNKWTMHVLHTFNPAKTLGYLPTPGLAIDSAGNIYGTTSVTSRNGEVGTVFELSPQASGKWVYSVIHRFGGSGDGFDPLWGPTIDPAGNLFGTTYAGGAHNYGTVYKLAKDVDGWHETILHDFDPASGDGAVPQGALTLDSAGNIYGTTGFYTSTADYGSVFKLALGADGQYAEAILQFFYDGTEGAYPSSNLILDASGSVYGEAANSSSGNGVFFKLTESAGKWTESVVYAFQGAPDGSIPNGGLIVDSAGDFYGATGFGGTANDGVVFEILP